MKNRWFSLILLLVSTSSLADSFSTTAVSDKTDLSISFLDQIFGTVGEVLTGTSGQMLGHLFKIFNEGILVIMGLWLGYTVLTTVLRSANEGSFMGQNRNIAFSFLKIALAVSLLIPNASTGYSLLQNMVMKVVVAGVGFADQTWNTVLQYIQNGGSVWHSPTDSGGSDNNKVLDKDSIFNNMIANTTLNVTNNAYSADNLKLAQLIYSNEVCMQASNLNQSVGGLRYRPITDEKNSQILFPGTGNTSLDAEKYDSNGIGNGEKPQCGSISWNIQNACNNALAENGDDTSEDANVAKCYIAKNAVYQLVDVLNTAARKYVCNSEDYSKKDSCLSDTLSDQSGNITNNTAQLVLNGILGYINAILPLANMNEGNNSNSGKDFIAQAKQDGWLTAGRYYWDLARAQDHYSAVHDISTYIPTRNNHEALQYRELASSAAGSLGGSTSTPIQSKINDLIDKTNNASSAGGNAKSSSHQGISGLWPALALVVSPAISDIGHILAQFSTTDNKVAQYDPIVFLHNIGMECFKFIGDLWFTGGMIFAGLMMSTMICRAQFNSTPIVSSAVNFGKGFFVAITPVMLIVGSVLGLYLPLYPYMLFTFGIISWIIAVLEAIVAAPLVCLGLTHPEGHDFLGEAKQAMMLLLGVFIRPALMIIGLIAAMIVSFVAFRILIYTFSGIASDLFSNSTAATGANSVLTAAGKLMSNYMGNSAATWSFGGVIESLIIFPMVLMIFAMLVYITTTQCFSLIYVLPDNILRWIGSPTTPSPAGQMASQISGMLSSGGGQIASAQDKGLLAKEKGKLSQINRELEL